MTMLRDFTIDSRKFEPDFVLWYNLACCVAYLRRLGR
jgi:hypothetical protein